MDKTIEKTIGQIVAEDYRIAQVFKNHGIDFCCKGDRSVEEVAQKNNVDASLLYKEIETIQNQNTNESIDFKSWSLDLLADYIEKKHHRYVEAKIPVLKQYLNKLCKVHGSRHPELFEITEHFNASAGELTAHMKKEELILFPIIRKMIDAKLKGLEMSKPHFGTVENPIEMMMNEHENEGDRFREIDRLSNSYTPPADACNTYQVTFSLLKEFEDDLHQHIHLENNILFPKAIILEKEIAFQN
ncbi:iron-sulfur cluster repair di-iron protein [Aureibaculum sp. A20]|uniref:Iron-sulfur cluster repair di-iron protein n=1 Tax=Aureibaculum flavum TaxID=2795986 RepID=A0ABS0WMY0_9FLAO|nr:iron-sulfur cluster repair di-iron protein [Aureibaculum flavum]MBJ2173330.1 iron-sulfur cluster repair di-iron protein [Aureibaculum flavum]